MGTEKGTPGKFSWFQNSRLFSACSSFSLHLQGQWEMCNWDLLTHIINLLANFPILVILVLNLHLLLGAPRTHEYEPWTILVDRQGLFNQHLVVVIKVRSSFMALSSVHKAASSSVPSKMSPIDNPLLHLPVRPVQVVVDDDLIMHTFLLGKCHLLVRLL